MKKRILIIQGHPDNTAPHLLHGLADAYANAAREAGHEVRTTTVAELDFPLLRSQHAWGSTANCRPACARRRRTSAGPGTS
jgi:putative NADPH-quinone reductase